MIKQSEDSIKYLSKVSGMLIGIQWLVASTAKDVRIQTPRPRLPNSLVHAFDKLLIYYILTSKQLSLLSQFFRGTKNSQATRDLLEDRQQQLESRHAHLRLDVSAALRKTSCSKGPKIEMRFLLV